MKKLKVPGRIIGKLISSPYRRYFYPVVGKCPNTQYRFMDDTDLPVVLPDYQGNPQDPIKVAANAIRTFWNSPWKDDPQLITRHSNSDGEIDQDGRDRMGMLVKPPMLNEFYVRTLIVKYLLNHTVGILADGKVIPAGRCWCWQTRICAN